MPGLVVGAYAGNRLGAIRDAKGKSVAAVFSELGASQKVEVRGNTCFGTRALLLNLTFVPTMRTDLARTRPEGVGCRLYLSSNSWDGPLMVLCILGDSCTIRWMGLIKLSYIITMPSLGR